MVRVVDWAEEQCTNMTPAAARAVVSAPSMSCAHSTLPQCAVCTPSSSRASSTASVTWGEGKCNFMSKS